MELKANKVKNHDNFKSKEECIIAQDKFDKGHYELHKYCETQCKKYKLDKLDWFPMITQIRLKLHIYRWIVGLKRGKKCGIHNLERAFQKLKKDNE